MFDIEPISLVISLVLILLFSTPFVIFKRKQSQKIKTQKLFLEQLQNKAGLKFDQSDDWRDRYFIGLDSERKVLVYAIFDAENTVHQIDLSKATDVKVLKMEREAKVEGKSINVIDSLNLKIELMGEKAETKILEFYDSELFSDNLGEWPLIQKWQENLKGILKNKPTSVKKTSLK
jgi:hypothetical protein